MLATRIDGMEHKKMLESVPSERPADAARLEPKYVYNIGCCTIVVFWCTIVQTSLTGANIGVSRCRFAVWALGFRL